MWLSISINEVLPISNSAKPRFVHHERGGVCLIHRAAFPVLPDFADSITPEKKTVYKGNRNSHGPKPMKFLAHIFLSVACSIPSHIHHSFKHILSEKGDNYLGYYSHLLLNKAGKTLNPSRYSKVPPISNINNRLIIFTNIIHHLIVVCDENKKIYQLIKPKL